VVKEEEKYGNSPEQNLISIVRAGTYRIEKTLLGMNIEHRTPKGECQVCEYRRIKLVDSVK